MWTEEKQQICIQIVYAGHFCYHNRSFEFVFPYKNKSNQTKIVHKLSKFPAYGKITYETGLIKYSNICVCPTINQTNIQQ